MDTHCKTGVSSLSKFQERVRHVKRAKTAGVHIETVLDLRRWASAHALPDQLADLVDNVTYAVPMMYR